ncbi:MAG: ABC transporter substrate-binding protein [bacterium]|nr:ABC transporter substrate-binding protein [bacterium]
MTIIRVAHSPDSDDAFMFYPLANNTLDTEGLVFEHVMGDIESLNREAFNGTYEVTAVSIHAYAHLDERYGLLGSGASMGDGYGPVLIANQRLSEKDLVSGTVAVPGDLTSAALALKLWNPSLSTIPVPFDEIGEAVKSGKVDAGVIIHEGQLTWKDEGFEAIVDLGKWWAEENDGLPLPLGGNVIRRDLGEEMIAKVARLLHASIAHSLENREKALEYALQFGRGLSAEKADRFVGMYVNELTLDYGERGRKGMQLFLERAHSEGLIPHVPQLDFFGSTS